ncbi:hypothetical protein H8S90_00615 [Olivibacter sp. SDN3]|uniref:hypothetical protein n=1 Tax=Olivibacter sp. SDN3 TaxID=2764720 RepID=UPI001651A11A|nr:hypothetical protein [Olivibacter sp. SDN3]QNL50174.1 hypothetical protein H8S90_00615 [Olivibacter sp. SDN3]
MQKRITCTLSATAKERYHRFLADQLSIVQGVPQHMLASFFGDNAGNTERSEKTNNHLEPITNILIYINGNDLRCLKFVM